MPSNGLLDALVEDFINSTLYNPVEEKCSRSRVMGNPKRYAGYFPSKASLNAKCAAPEEESTWEFSSPAYHPSRSSSITSYSTSGSTPAQDIVIRYRSGQTIDVEEPRSCSPSQDSDSGSPGVSCLDFESDFEYVPLAPVSGTKPAPRASRDEALFSTYQEALKMAKGRVPNARVVCQRAGCRDTLPNVKALMYHLHIHDIHDRSIVCPHCKGHYDAECESRMHDCTGRRRSLSPLSSPLREGFRRIFNKFMH